MIFLMLFFATIPGIPASKIYDDCVTSEASRLERSGETASLVADVAITKCSPLLPAAVDQLIADVHNRSDVRAYEEREHRPFTDYDLLRTQTWEGVKKLARDDALAAVVEARARRRIK